VSVYALQMVFAGINIGSPNSVQCRLGTVAQVVEEKLIGHISGITKGDEKERCNTRQRILKLV
jgi:hypothetical protein